MTKDLEVPLNVIGLPTVRNKGAFSWSPNGLIAIGSATDILIIDAEKLSSVQVINSDHKSSINRVIWNPFSRQLHDAKPSKYHADLLSTDTLNNLLIWDVDKSQVLSSFNHPESKQLLDVQWSNGPDTWKRSKVYLLYSTNLFVIYDVYNHHSFQNVQIFEPQGLDITSFDINPYSASTINSFAFLGEGFVLLSNFDPLKADKILVTVTIPLSKNGGSSGGSISGGGGSSGSIGMSGLPGGRDSVTLGGIGHSNSFHSELSFAGQAQQPLLSSIGKRQSSSSSIRKLVSDIIVGPENPLNQIIVRFGTLEFLHSMKDHLVVWTSREIYFVNSHFHVVLHVFSLEKSLTPIVSVVPCKTRPVLFTVHENGTLFLRKYTINSQHHSHSHNISLDTVGLNENPRLSSKKSEILGASLEPTIYENKFLLYLSDGRIITYSLFKSNRDKYGNLTKAVLTNQQRQPKLLLPTPVTPGAYDSELGIVAQTTANTESSPSSNIVITGSNNNNSSKPIENKYVKLNSLVKGILESHESSSTNSDISNTHQSSPIKLKMTRVMTSIGQVTCLKTLEKGVLVCGTSTGHVLIVKCTGFGETTNTNKNVMHTSTNTNTGTTGHGHVGGRATVGASGHHKAPTIFRKFSIHSNTSVNGLEVISETEILTWANLSFSANPKCELSLTEVSFGASKMLKQDEPSHIATVRVSPSKQYFIIVYKNGSAPCELWDLPRRQLIKTLPSKLPPITCVQWKEPAEGSKESGSTFYMTDLGTFLFTFRVDGNRFSNATCVKLDTSANLGGIPVTLFTRGNLVFRGDSSGTLTIYNTEKKTASPGVNLGRGPLFKILDFGDYFITQFSDQLELWDGNQIQKLRLLHPNKLKSTDIALVNDNFLAVLVKNSGGIKFLPLNISSLSGDWYPGTKVKIDSSLITNYPYFWSNKEKCRRILEFLTSPTKAIPKGKDPKEYLNLVYKLNVEPDEVKFWRIVNHSIRKSIGVNDDAGEDDLNDPDVFSDGKVYKEILVKIAQCVWLMDSKKREDVGRTLILSGEAEKSAEILLDTEPSDAKNYIANGLKAAISVGCTNMPEATKAVLKIVATNLIASGQNDQGLELLCMLWKHSEACKYIESANDWEKALLLCKTTLFEPPASVQGNETLSKYAQFLNTSRFVYKAASLYVYIGKYDRAVEVLFGARKRHLAYILLDICENNQVSCPVSDHIKLAIKLDFARFLFDMGLTKEAISFCESLGEEGKDVKAELEILSS